MEWWRRGGEGDRDITIAVLVFVAAHPVLLWFTSQREKVLVRLDLFGSPLFPRWGFYAAVCLALLAAAAFGKRRWRIPCELWRRSHAILAAAIIALVSLHVLTERHYLALAWKQVEFTVKALGDFTRRVPQAAPGERVFVDGPFGAISADRRRRAAG